MAGNTTPIFPSAPDWQWLNTDGNGGAAGPLKTADNVYDASGTPLTILTAGAAGEVVKAIGWHHAGTNASANVGRMWINNGSAISTVGNNTPIGEVMLPTFTASATAPAAVIWFVPPDGAIWVPPLFKIIVAIGTTVAAGYFVNAYGGPY